MDQNHSSSRSHIIDTTQDTQTHQQNLHTMDSLTTTEHEVGTSHNMNAKGCDEHICASHQSKMSLSAECLAAADNTLTPPCPTPLSDEGQSKILRHETDQLCVSVGVFVSVQCVARMVDWNKLNLSNL